MCVPFLTRCLSAGWLELITRADYKVARELLAIIPLAAILVVGGCRREQPSQASPDPITSAAPTKPKPPRALFEWLSAAQIDDRTFAKATLYTWTTVDQIDALAKGGPVLERSSSPVGTSIYQVDLLVHQEPFARRLLGDEFARVRFAWSAGWPTVLGLAGHGYGDHLIAVHLKPTAVIARLERGESFRFHDLQQRDVPEADVVAHPERVAAVLHVHPGAPGDELRYREYVIVNESMIEEWSYGTPELIDLVAGDRRNLTELRRWLGDGDGVKLDLAAIWRDGAPPDDVTARYLGALAFDNPAYRPKTLGWDALLAALVPPSDARAAMRVAPTATWPPPPLPKPGPTGPLKPTVW